jgi:hypothetical protein
MRATTNEIRRMIDPSESTTWIVGDRRRWMRRRNATDTPRASAALVIGSLIGFGVVALGVAALT